MSEAATDTTTDDAHSTLKKARRSAQMIKRPNWKHVLLLVVAIPVVTQIAGYFGRSLGQHVNQTQSLGTPTPSLTQDIRVAVSSQDAEGITQRHFDLGFLKNLESYLVERTTLKTREALSSQGQPGAQFDLTSEATYVESGSIKLAVIRLRLYDGSNHALISNHAVIAGVVDRELKRVTCIRNSPEMVPVSYGVCADKVNHTFGTKFVE